MLFAYLFVSLHTMTEFHPLHTTLSRPQQLNNPLDYEPHPLCLLAADEVRAYLRQQTQWADEVANGKMFGVLVCEDEAGQLGFLAAYSGQIGGREDWPWFVPAVFDYLRPEGFFKQEEARISAINRQVEHIEQSVERTAIIKEVSRLKEEALNAVETYKKMMQEAKARRDGLRATQGETEEMIRESQFQKAELRRLKKHWAERLAAAAEQLQPMEAELTRLKRTRKQRSDFLQRWLFDHFMMRNKEGDFRSLTEIFADTPQGVPPSGSGECCAPKLLQFAFMNHLRPLSIAEFWQGRSPSMEIRHHDQFYTACRGKCKPILEWMLGIKDLTTDTEDMKTGELEYVSVVEGRYAVVCKPAGMLSVPGRSKQPSVESILRAKYGEAYMVHRLDMDTSGLLVVALSKEAHKHLQMQFRDHTVSKLYRAQLERPMDSPSCTIELPLRPDPMDRPRQVVDYEHGKPAKTFCVKMSGNNVLLDPRTGRTHQLRVHCAHKQGLSNPIKGDRLYGHKADRLYLHAEVLSFLDPVTENRLMFRRPAPF